MKKQKESPRWRTSPRTVPSVDRTTAAATSPGLAGAGPTTVLRDATTAATTVAAVPPAAVTAVAVTTAVATVEASVAMTAV
ncbi:hypothetical protein ACFVGM_34550, partial [Kitasatospora purpeofusca]